MTSISALFETVREREPDRNFLAADLLDVLARKRRSALPWRGQFTPGLPELLIDAYDGETGVIFDPFAGSGTTLLEAQRRGRASVGVEVNPAAYLLARILELANEPADERRAVLESGSRNLRRCLVADVNGGLFGNSGSDSGENVASKLIEITAGAPSAKSVLDCVLLLSMGDKKETCTAKILKSWASVEELIRSMPRDPVRCAVTLGDARSNTTEADSVGLTITSPPYINVFNYHQNYRPAVELLGWQVLPAARSEIGSNRKHRSNRFLTVIQYAQDMLSALTEIVRVSKHGANVVLVVGRESRVRGVSFANGEILATLAASLGTLKFTRWQERKFLNRFGVTIYEEILAFEVDKVSDISTVVDIESVGRGVGVFCLDEAADKAPLDVAGEIKAAVAAANGVRQSPLVAGGNTMIKVPW